MIWKGGIFLKPGFKKIASAALTFLAVWVFLRCLLPLFSPFLLGLALALSAEPMVDFLHRRLRLPRGVSACVGVSMAFCFLAMALLILCAFVVRELKNLSGALPDLERAARSGYSLAQNWLLHLSAQAPGSLRPLIQENVNALFSNGAALVDKAIRYLLGLAGSLLSHIPDSALGLGTAIVSGFMISAKLPGIKGWLSRRLPKEKLRPLLEAWGRIKRAVGGWLTAQCKLMGVTFVILLLGLLLLRVPYAPLWAVGIALIDAFPVLGTGTVLIPWSVLSLLQGNGALALGLLGIYLTASLTRSALEPRLVGRHLGLDPLVTLMALYAGYKLWGIGGMLLAPLLTVTALQVFPDGKQE